MQRCLPFRPDGPFFRSETKFRLVEPRPVEIGGHLSDDLPGRRLILAGTDSGNRGGARKAKAPNSGSRVAF